MLKKFLLASSVMFSASAIAHDVIIIPSSFSVNKSPTNVAVDISSTHGLFRIERGVSVDNISVFTPDGKSMRSFGTVVKGSTRTSFELPVSEEGTYKITYGSAEAGYTTSYTIGERETNKRLRGTNKSEAASVIPEGASNIVTTKSARTALVYITNKLPTEQVFTPTGKGFELVPVTHPADYINGEPIQFQLLLDGKPATGARVEVKSEASIYGRDLTPLELFANEDGMVAMQFNYGGRYVARITFELEVSQDPQADREAYTVFYPFEVIFE